MMYQVLKKAVNDYNAAVRALCKNYSTSNENKAYEKASYLKGVMDTIKATGFGVRIHYVDSAFFSEIDEYDITVIK